MTLSEQGVRVRIKGEGHRDSPETSKSGMGRLRMLTCSLCRPLPALGSLACSRARRCALKPSMRSPCCSARAAIACCEEFAYLQMHQH